ncbi:ATP-binding protein, partial [Corallococcus praedator]
RKLIGKLGIGLFALSQLTHEFQIITKQKGDDTRTVADVLLFRYAEDKAKAGDSEEEEFHTGSVRLWKVPARDKKTHGTEIILRNLLPRTKAELASYELWTVIHAPVPADGDDEERDRRERPRYHLGCLDPDHPGEFL